MFKEGDRCFTRYTKGFSNLLCSLIRITVLIASMGNKDSSQTARTHRLSSNHAALTNVGWPGEVVCIWHTSENHTSPNDCAGPNVRKRTGLRTSVPSEDSDQPAHSRSLIRIITGRNLDSQGCRFFMRTTKTDQTARMRRLICVFFERSSEGTFSKVCGSYVVVGA